MIECDRCHKKFATYAALRQHYSNQHPNAKWPETFENELIEERKLQAYKTSIHPTRTSHARLFAAVILIVIVIGAASVYLPTLSSTNTANPACANFPFAPINGQDLAEHYHVMLLIYVKEEKVSIPVNTGEGDSGPCAQPLHVHASEPNTDVIHVESPQERSYTLRDFFRVWAATSGVGGPSPVVFNQNQIFNYSAGNGFELRMYVNGQQSTAYNSLVIQSHMIIVIAYGNAATDWARYQSVSGEQWPYLGY
jgi:hypothetical protein